MSQITTWREAGGGASYRKKIRAELGKGTVTATDIREIAGPGVPQPAPRYLTFKGRTYCQGWICPVPEGKSWVLLSENEKTRPFLQSGGIDLAHPGALKAVLATTESKHRGGAYDNTRTTVYQGTSTFGDLYKVSPAFRDQHDGTPTGKYAKTELSWQLWLGEDQLVRRVRTSWPEQLGKRSISNVVDARLTGWGAKADIAAPSADETAGPDDWRNSPS
ncbi:hypothetical protein FAF44_04225 [Nonomuraea sp. MG754425]|uniref:hypothetical protein n=1 Tax=Nonomuraea sp. MG754425 TaxID=2570319 RepID=UPI001F3BC4C0|nr:hypothetical protein [Nonomuraea sp. MG754425]MCF6467619.1 hypothetical protein [Nonomuraea sp. MG754425]